MGVAAQVQLSESPQEQERVPISVENRRRSPPLLGGDPNPLPTRGTWISKDRTRRRVRKSMSLEFFHKITSILGVLGREGQRSRI